jgi:uncharacterized membrane protein YccC
MKTPAGSLRGVADARTARSLPVRVGPGGEPDVYARLTQLARERQRLAGEQDLWQRKLERIARRLAEIDTQIQRLQSRTGQPDPASPRPPWREVEFPY